MFSADLAPTSPWPRTITLRETSSTSHVGCSTARAALILREQSDFAIVSIKNRPRTSIFSKCHDCWCRHENLGLLRKSVKQILWNLSCWENLTQILAVRAPIVPAKFTGRNLEKIQVAGCQPHICVQRPLSANFALATNYYAPRDQLYESCRMLRGTRSANFA